MCLQEGGLQCTTMYVYHMPQVCVWGLHSNRFETGCLCLWCVSGSLNPDLLSIPLSPPPISLQECWDLRLICYHISVLFGSWGFELRSSRSCPYSISYSPSSKLIINYKISLTGDGTPGDPISSEIEIWLNPGNKHNIKTYERIKIPWFFMWASCLSLSWNSGMFMYKRPKNIFKSQEHPRKHACTVPK